LPALSRAQTRRLNVWSLAGVIEIVAVRSVPFAVT
jgi:hypothetical protein